MAPLKGMGSVHLLLFGIFLSAYFCGAVADEALEYPPSPPPFPAPVYGGPPSPPPSVVIPAEPSSPVLDAIQSRPDLTIVTMAIQALGLSKTFEGNFTAFFPSDAAFQKLASAMNLNVTQLVMFQGSVQAILQYHIVPRAMQLTSMIPTSGESNTTVETMLGNASYQQLCLLFDNSDASVRVRATSSMANVVAKDIVAGSGYINVVDTVLQFWYPNLTQALQNTNGLSTLQTVLKDTGLLSSLETMYTSYTLFAPTDQAFYASNSLGLSMNSDTLAYHVVTPAILIDAKTASKSYTALNSKNLTITSYKDGANVTVSSFVKGRTAARVIARSIPFGGIMPNYIHVVDTVLIPTYTSVFEYVSNEPTFSTLTSLLKAENSVIKTLNNSEAVTLLAPTDAALATFGKTFFNNVNLSAVALASKDMTALLQGSVVTKSLTYEGLNQNITLDTLLGTGTIKVYASAAGPFLNANRSNARTTQPRNTSILYGRAYVHAIDFVLLKDNPTVNENGAASATVPSLLVLLLAILAGVMLL